MAPNEYREVDAHPGGIASRVKYQIGTTWYSGGLAWIMPVCGDCGALLVDQELHDEWHEELDKVEEDE